MNVLIGVMCAVEFIRAKRLVEPPEGSPWMGTEKLMAL